MQKKPKRLALVSVSDKTNLLGFVKHLIEKDYGIISTGGTAAYLEKNGIEASTVENLTQFPEILSGRVKTLHPAVHAGILARLPQDQKDMDEMGFLPIDMVVVNLYPFSSYVQEKRAHDDCIEQIDIGGVTLLRSAAKNHDRVCVVSHPLQYPVLQEELALHNHIRRKMRRDFATEAFINTVRYDTAIFNYLRSEFSDAPLSDLPLKVMHQWERAAVLRYGENPHQKGALYINPELHKDGFINFESSGEKSLTYNNLVDLEAAYRTVSNFTEPTCAIIKHAIPCGVASAPTLISAWRRAFNADTTSAFGGIIAFNRTLDIDTSKEIAKAPFVECVAVPGITVAARKVLMSKPRIQIITVPKPKYQSMLQFKSISGGLLIQTVDRVEENPKDWQLVTKKSPSQEQLADLDFAWKIVSNVRSNAIVCAQDQITTGIGSGQTSRIKAVQLALTQAGDHPGVLASDAFFPFPDAIVMIAEAGISAVVQTGGSKKDQDVIEEADRRGIAMLFTGVRHFTH